MKDSETLLAAILGIVGLEFLSGWVGYYRGFDHRHFPDRKGSFRLSGGRKEKKRSTD